MSVHMQLGRAPTPTFLLTTSVFCLSALALAGSASPVAAQDSRWSLDLQAGLAAPTTEIEGDELGNGFGFEVNGAYRIATHVSVYAGWDWHLFSPDQLFAGPDVELEETGYAFGLRFDHPFRGEGGGSGAGDGASWRLRAGLTANHLELEDADGELVDDSGHEVGFEVGAGVFFPLSRSWRVGPEVRYRSLATGLEVDGDEVDVDLNYAAVDLVLSYRF